MLRCFPSVKCFSQFLHIWYLKSVFFLFSFRSSFQEATSANQAQAAAPGSDADADADADAFSCSL